MLPPIFRYRLHFLSIGRKIRATLISLENPTYNIHTSLNCLLI